MLEAGDFVRYDGPRLLAPAARRGCRPVEKGSVGYLVRKKFDESRVKWEVAFEGVSEYIDVDEKHLSLVEKKPLVRPLFFDVQYDDDALEEEWLRKEFGIEDDFDDTLSRRKRKFDDEKGVESGQRSQ